MVKEYKEQIKKVRNNVIIYSVIFIIFIIARGVNYDYVKSSQVSNIIINIVLMYLFIAILLNYFSWWGTIKLENIRKEKEKQEEYIKKKKNYYYTFYENNNINNEREKIYDEYKRIADEYAKRHLIIDKENKKINNAFELFKLNSTQSTDVEIKKRYKELAMKWHPDKWVLDTKQNQDIANRNFQKLNAAYEIIKKYKNIN